MNGLPGLMIDQIGHGDVVALLEHLHSGGGQHERHPVGPALVARVVKAVMVHRFFAVLLHHGGRLGLQDRIVIIADELEHIAAAVAARQIDERGRA